MSSGFTRRAFVRHAGLAASAIWAGAAGARGQEPGPPRVFRSDVEVVTTPVTVRDASGRLVTGLTRADFEIFEDGQAQPLAHFTAERVPVSLALVVDVSDSMFGDRIRDARAALGHFVDRLLEEVDETALVVFNHRPRVMSGWTQDRAQLRERLETVVPSGGTAMYDAVAGALPLFPSRRHPRGAMVLLSDGADNSSDMTLAELRRRLTPLDVVVYAIALGDARRARRAAANPYALHDLTAQSGGYAEILAGPADLGPATSRIAEELNHQYMLGYTPNRRPDGQYHTIRVRVKGDGYRVRSRRGYIASRD